MPSLRDCHLGIMTAPCQGLLTVLQDLKSGLLVFNHETLNYSATLVVDATTSPVWYNGPTCT
jgi:hypothetical protein